MSPTPHDALFKHVFSQPQHAVGELRTVLPAALCARIAWDTLTLVPGSFVDEALKERHTDLLYTVRLDGHVAMLYVLVEHQSSVDALMPFRLLRYMVRAWDAFLANHAGATRLPAIVPVVVHHSQTDWTASTAFEDLIDLDGDARAAVATHLPKFSFLLDDLTAQADDEIRKRAMLTALARLVLLALKHGRGIDVERKVADWSRMFRDVLGAPHGADALIVVVRYLMEVAPEVAPEDFGRIFARQVGEETREVVMTAAEILRAQGREEGQALAVVNLLEGRGLACPDDLRAKILSCRDRETLLRWLLRAATAANANDVVHEP